MTKNVEVSAADGAEATLKNNHNLFARILLLAQSQEIDLKKVLAYSLGPFPLSLSTEMGFLHKTQKSKLMTTIEASVQNHMGDCVPEGNAIFLDGMALIQSAKRLPSSFGDNRIVVYFCHDDKCHDLQPDLDDNASSTVQEVASLSCDHEEVGFMVAVWYLHGNWSQTMKHHLTQSNITRVQRWQRLDIITAQSVFQLPKIDKENFSTFRPEGLHQES